MPPVSVVIITLNEASRLKDALDSVAWADERIVVDSGSTDDTMVPARAHADRVEVRSWTGYADQKNYAAALARHDWILSLDADERVSLALTDEIRQLLSAEPAARGYRAPRVTHYLGQWIRCTDWWPDWQLRLYDRRAARWGRVNVHESVQLDGPAAYLSGELLHYPYRTSPITSPRLTTRPSRPVRCMRPVSGPPGCASPRIRRSRSCETTSFVTASGRVCPGSWCRC